MLDSRRRRGWILVLVMILFVGVSVVSQLLVSARADSRASHRERELHSVLDRELPPLGFVASEAFVRDHKLRSLTEEEGQLYATTDAGVLWEARCIVGRRDVNGKVVTRVLNHECTSVRPAAVFRVSNSAVMKIRASGSTTSS